MDYGISHKFSEDQNAWEVILTGEFDIFNSAELKNELYELINQKKISLNIDCTELKYLDSTAIGSLVMVLKNVKTYGGNIVLRNLKPNLLKLFRITNLNKVFDIEGEANE